MTNIGMITRDIRRHRAREYYERKRSAESRPFLNPDDVRRAFSGHDDIVYAASLDRRYRGRAVPSIFAHSAKYLREHPELLTPSVLIDEGMLVCPTIVMPDKMAGRRSSREYRDAALRLQERQGEANAATTPDSLFVADAMASPRGLTDEGMIERLKAT